MIINIVPLSIITFFVAIAVIVSLYWRLRKNSITNLEFAFWAVLWAGIALVVLFPRTTDVVAQLFGVEKGAELALFVAILILFWLHFRTMLHIEKIERDITKIVREIALRNDKSKS